MKRSILTPDALNSTSAIADSPPFVTTLAVQCAPVRAGSPEGPEPGRTAARTACHNRPAGAGERQRYGPSK
ncbi:hypothetical protein GCM10010504_54250 [Streptomyces griseus]|nr:hypothetical protein GCM10010504_54250 [Streptomyces griseus]